MASTKNKNINLMTFEDQTRLKKQIQPTDEENKTKIKLKYF